MANASKAIIIAGGFFIAVLIISVCMYLYTSFSESYADNMLMHEMIEIEAFNLFFVSFPSKISGDAAYNIIGKIDEVNNNYDAITDITYLGTVDKDTEFYFTENFENSYSYSYGLDIDGIIDWVKIEPIS